MRCAALTRPMPTSQHARKLTQAAPFSRRAGTRAGDVGRPPPDTDQNLPNHAKHAQHVFHALRRALAHALARVSTGYSRKNTLSRRTPKNGLRRNERQR